jgi:hypothetical protein
VNEVLFGILVLVFHPTWILSQCCSVDRYQESSTTLSQIIVRERRWTKADSLSKSNFFSLLGSLFEVRA